MVLRVAIAERCIPRFFYQFISLNLLKLDIKINIHIAELIQSPAEEGLMPLPQYPNKQDVLHTGLIGGVVTPTKKYNNK